MCSATAGCWPWSGRSTRTPSAPTAGSPEPDRYPAPMIRVAVFGAGGRMGAMVCRTVAAEPELELVAAVDPHHAGLDVRQVTGAESPGMQVAPSSDALGDAGAEVAVDFTEAHAA